MITSLVAVLTSWITWLGLGTGVVALGAIAIFAPTVLDTASKIAAPIAQAVGEKMADTIHALWGGFLFILDNGRALAFCIVFGLACYSAGKYVENQKVWSEIRSQYKLIARK